MRLSSLFAAALTVLFLFGCSGVFGSGFDSQLKQYERDDNPKSLTRYIVHQSKFKSEDIQELIAWSLDNRWQFLKLVDHLRGDDRKLFLSEFSDALKTSSLKASFTERYNDSPSRSIQEILTLAR